MAETRAEQLEALRVHDHVRAEKLLLEIQDQTAICAAMADGIAAQRRLVLGTDKPWPLGPLS